ncbi:hypothetical protein GCM10027273_11690 [Nocardioides pakistanensis]
MVGLGVPLREDRGQPVWVNSFRRTLARWAGDLINRPGRGFWMTRPSVVEPASRTTDGMRHEGRPRALVPLHPRFQPLSEPLLAGAVTIFTLSRAGSATLL